MSTIMPQGDDLRNAVKWLSSERTAQPEKNLQALVSEASAKFDLSPLDTEFLSRFIQENREGSPSK